MTLRVVGADDRALVRVGFCGILAATPGFTVVGEAGNGAEAVEAARRTRPDVLLMDVRMPVMDGIEATRRITASTDVRALILTTFDLDEYVFAALRAGASGFLLKDTLPADLLTAIRVVAAGDALLAPSVTRRLIGEFTRTVPGIGADHGTSAPPTTAQASDTGSACDRLQRVLTQLAGALLDLAVVVVFRAPGQPPPGEEHVEAGQDGQPDAQCERDSPRRFLGCVPVHDVGGAEKDPAAEEQPAFDLHLGTPPLLR